MWFSNRRARLRKQMSPYSSAATAAPPVVVATGTSNPLPLPLPYAGGSGSMLNVVNPVAAGSSAAPYTNLSGCESAHLYSTASSIYSTPLSPSLPASAIHQSSYGSSSSGRLVATNPQVIHPELNEKELELIEN